MDLINIPLDTDICPRITPQHIDRFPEVGDTMYLRRFHHGHQQEICETLKVTSLFQESKCFVYVNGDRLIMIGWNNGLTDKFEYNPLLFLELINTGQCPRQF